MKKTVAILGASGKMGSGLARSLSTAGYNVLAVGRDAVKLNELICGIKKNNPHAGIEIVDCLKEASWEADIIIPAVPYEAQEEVAYKIKDVVTGKIVLSITNPLNKNYYGLLTQTELSAAEELAELLPHSKIVKAFNTISAADLDLPIVEGKKANVLIAADDQDAAEVAAELVYDAGFSPLKTGRLSMSRTLESMIVLMIEIFRRNNFIRRTGWKILN